MPRIVATWRRSRLDLAVAVAYLGAAALILARLWADPGRLTPAENTTDETAFEWWLVHAVRVFTTGSNPLVSTQLNVPTGVNAMVNTSMLGIALPAAPITAWLGPSIVFVLLLTLGLAGTAFAWHWVISRHFVGTAATPDRLAGLIGGAICGFGPGMIAHVNGHPNLTAQFCVPLIVWRALALRESRHPWRDGAILGALITYQAFINEEVLLGTALAGLVFVIAYALFRPSAAGHGIRRLAAGLGIAAGTAALLLAYPLWYQFTGPGHVHGLPLYQLNAPYRLPLRSFVQLPGQSILGNAAANASLASPVEENSFLGWPVVIVALAIVVVLWRRVPAVRALLAVAVVFGYASLGNRIEITSPARTYPLSLWSHVQSLPPLDSVLPSRLALAVLPVVGLLYAHAIARARHVLATTVPRASAWTARSGRYRLGNRPVRMRWAGAGRRWPNAVRARLAAVAGILAIITALVTVIPRQITTVVRPPVPVLFTSGDWRRYVPTGYTVLTATPADRGGSMRWSIATGLAFGIPGGYFFGPDRTGRARYGPIPRPTMVRLVAAGAGHVTTDVSAAVRAQTVADLIYWRAAIVVLVPDQPHASNVAHTLDRLIGPGLHVDGVTLWDVLPVTRGGAATGRDPG